MVQGAPDRTSCDSELDDRADSLLKDELAADGDLAVMTLLREAQRLMGLFEMPGRRRMKEAVATRPRMRRTIRVLKVTVWLSLDNCTPSSYGRQSAPVAF